LTVDIVLNLVGLLELVSVGSKTARRANFPFATDRLPSLIGSQDHILQFDRLRAESLGLQPQKMGRKEETPFPHLSREISPPLLVCT
jgi:hypothetical protein